MPGSQTAALCAALRRSLKQRGIRHADAAQHCGVGVASIKRWLAGRGLTLHRLEQLAALAGLTLADLAETTAAPQPDLAKALTLAQEKRSPMMICWHSSLSSRWAASRGRISSVISACHQQRSQPR